MQYIFGYGSLICRDSRSRTGATQAAHAIEVSGIQRKWSVHTPDWPATAVGAHIEPNASCNGVYFAVDNENLAKFDEREQGYQRIAIPWHKVTPHIESHSLPEKGTLWAYVGAHSTAEPDENRPIMQSYVDVILNGCLDFGDTFARRFTETTLLWQHLVDDRHSPQYPRPLVDTRKQPAIDTIIQQTLPQLWQHRRRYP